MRAVGSRSSVVNGCGFVGSTGERVASVNDHTSKRPRVEVASGASEPFDGLSSRGGEGKILESLSFDDSRVVVFHDVSVVDLRSEAP
jgi:hypothetical protein